MRAARQGLEHIGSDLVIYLNAESESDLLIMDRSKFLSVMTEFDTIQQALDEPARVKAARKLLLNKDALVFWLVVAEADGVRAQVLTLNNQYKLTTHFIGQA
jgi:hypothetical protein